VLLGIAAIYLAVTEGVAAWGSPRAPEAESDTDAAGSDTEASGDQDA
jgi:hypothetical protein